MQVSADGGTDPLWAGNGEIFYLRDDELRVVAPRRPGSLDFDAPRTLVEVGIEGGTLAGDEGGPFDVTRDGQRILAIRVPLASRPRQIEVVTDWTGKLTRLVPRGRP